MAATRWAIAFCGGKEGGREGRREEGTGVSGMKATMCER